MGPATAGSAVPPRSIVPSHATPPNTETRCPGAGFTKIVGPPETGNASSVRRLQRGESAPRSSDHESTHRLPGRSSVPPLSPPYATRWLRTGSVHSMGANRSGGRGPSGAKGVHVAESAGALGDRSSAQPSDAGVPPMTSHRRPTRSSALTARDRAGGTNRRGARKVQVVSENESAHVSSKIVVVRVSGL